MKPDKVPPPTLEEALAEIARLNQMIGLMCQVKRRLRYDLNFAQGKPNKAKKRP